VSCLGGNEQMGEGWSDFIGLMLTQRAGDTGAQRRGVGTYVGFEPTDGVGIRNAPYSTDFAVNDYTYQDVISFAYTTTSPGPRGLSVPHGVGFVWASAMWDMTWNLIDAHGYSADVYDADGAAGNQIALNLYATGLKLTSCSPGFVSGRDGILAADRLLYPDPNRPGEGLHYESIWRAFARRGVGVGADQGSTENPNDGTASFALPGGVASEATAGGGVARLSVAGPNPFTMGTTMALTVDRDQDVRVDLLDLLGRRVAVLYDGPVTVGAAVPVRVAGAGLPSGVYVVRAAGETFTLSERVTVAR
ncbi:MAG TPA: M36 family metallopeptidase, partial [Rubricoccaceae bacterium]